MTLTGFVSGLHWLLVHLVIRHREGLGLAVLPLLLPVFWRSLPLLTGIVSGSQRLARRVLSFQLVAVQAEAVPLARSGDGWAYGRQRG